MHATHKSDVVDYNIQTVRLRRDYNIQTFRLRRDYNIQTVRLRRDVFELW
jgi:hypothetical protein